MSLAIAEIALHKTIKFTKMTIKAKPFSLFDFCKKRADRLEVYGNESLDEEGNIIPFIDQAAYLHRRKWQRTRTASPKASSANLIVCSTATKKANWR